MQISLLQVILKLKTNNLNIKGKVKWDCDIKPLIKQPEINISTLKLDNKRTINYKPNQKEVNYYACPKMQAQ